jgi:hypothetical protein
MRIMRIGSRGELIQNSKAATRAEPVQKTIFIFNLYRLSFLPLVPGLSIIRRSPNFRGRGNDAAMHYVRELQA